MTRSDVETLARTAHGTDRMPWGGLVIDHATRVAAAMQYDSDPDAVIAALLHDVVERTSLDLSDLRAAGADERFVELVDALSERDGEPVEAYLARCAADPLALRIKRADLNDKLALDVRELTAETAEAVRDRARARLHLLHSLAAGRR